MTARRLLRLLYYLFYNQAEAEGVGKRVLLNRAEDEDLGKQHFCKTC